MKLHPLTGAKQPPSQACGAWSGPHHSSSSNPCLWARWPIRQRRGPVQNSAHNGLASSAAIAPPGLNSHAASQRGLHRRLDGAHCSSTSDRGSWRTSHDSGAQLPMPASRRETSESSWRYSSNGQGRSSSSGANGTDHINDHTTSHAEASSSTSITSSNDNGRRTQPPLNPRQLTGLIQAAYTAAFLRKQWDKHLSGGRANSIHISALMTKAAVLHSAPGASAEERATAAGLALEVARSAACQLPLLDDQALSNTIHSLARINLADEDVLEALLGGLGQRLPGLAPQHLSNVLWGLATLQHAPSQPWMAAYEAASAQQLHSCTAQGTANIAWALAKLGHSPGSAWWDTFWAATQPGFSGCKPQELAALLYSAGRLGQLPPEGWMGSYLEASCDLLPEHSAQELGMVLWGFAALGYRPVKAWLMLFFLTSRNCMAQCQAQELSLWLYSLARLGYRPSPVWLNTYVACSYRKLDKFSPQELSNTLWAAAAMDWTPPLKFWQALMECAQEAFPVCNAQDLANMLQSVAKLDGQPGKDWLHAFFSESRRHLPSFSALHLSNTAWSLRRLETRPPIDWLEAFIDAATVQLASNRFGAKALASMLSALDALGCEPAPEWLVHFLVLGRRELEALQGAAVDDGGRYSKAPATDGGPAPFNNSTGCDGAFDAHRAVGSSSSSSSSHSSRAIKPTPAQR